MIEWVVGLLVDRGGLMIHDRLPLWRRVLAGLFGVEMSPEPPQGVRLVKADGTVIPIETVYAGKDDKGCDDWKMIMPYHFDPHADHLEIAVLPARSAVTFWLTGDTPPIGFTAREVPDD